VNICGRAEKRLQILPTFKTKKQKVINILGAQEKEIEKSPACKTKGEKGHQF